MTDLTLKVDADNSSLDAAMDRSKGKIKELGESVKEAHEPLKKMGEFSNGVLEKLTGFAAPMSAAGTAMALIGGATEAWRGQLEKARDVMREVAALHEKFAAAGMGGRSVELIRAMRGAADGLSNEEMGSVFQGTTGASGLPNATAAQLVQSAKSAQTAKESGLEVGSFAKTRASLVSSGVKNADSTAFYLERYAPDTKDDALGAIRKYPDQAEDISRLYQAAGREEGKGQKGLKEIITKALGEYGLEKATNPGMTSSFMDAMNGAIGRRAAGDRPGELNRQFLMRQVAQPLDEGEMERRAIDNDKDPTSHARRIAERNIAFAKATTEESFGARVNRGTIKSSREEAATSDEPLGSFGLYTKFATGIALGMLRLPVSGSQKEAIEKVGYIQDGGDDKLPNYLGKIEAQQARAQADLMRKAIELGSRKRLAAQSSQNGDK